LFVQSGRQGGGGGGGGGGGPNRRNAGERRGRRGDKSGGLAFESGDCQRGGEPQSNTLDPGRQAGEDLNRGALKWLTWTNAGGSQENRIRFRSQLSKEIEKRRGRSLAKGLTLVGQPSAPEW